MKRFVFSAILTAMPVMAQADSFQLVSNDIKAGKMMHHSQEFNGFGCQGDNLSPQLSWRHAPEGTRSFAITAYDPDAPTGSGWWHWQIVNIPANVHELAKGAGDRKKDMAPASSLQISNDFGFQGFGGACPPKGDAPHHYQFTVYALSVETLKVSPESSGALVGYMIKSHALGSSTVEALYGRPAKN